MTSRRLRPWSALASCATIVAAALSLSCAGPQGSTAGAGAPPYTTVAAQAAAAAASAPGPDVADRAASGPMPVDPRVRIIELPNGMRLYVRKHGIPQKRAALRLVVNAGAVLERDDERGFAHFVEHMAFNGTRLFRKQEIVDYLERVGMRFGSDANASTSFDETIYELNVPSDDRAILNQGLLILQQIAHDVSFEADEVERERGVVIEEWRLGRGADMRVLEAILPTIFEGSRYAQRLPIGTKESLEHLTPEALRTFYRRWYRPDLMAVMAVGDFDVAAVEKEMRTIFGAIPKRPDKVGRPVFPVPAHDRTLVAVGQDAELGSTTVGVLHKMPRRPDVSEGDYRRHIVENLYHDMLNGRLEELSRGAEPPFLQAMSATQGLVRPLDVFASIASVKGNGIQRGLEALTREVERVDRFGFTPGELARAKAELLRRMQALAKERETLPSGSFADEMGRHFLVAEAMPGIEAELRLHERYLPTVSLDEMNRVARAWISEQNRVLIVQAPKAATVPAPQAMLDILRAADQAKLDPYVDRVANGPLVPKLPPPGRIVERMATEAIGVVEWKLANGARVVVKPTPFKEDEILVAATSPGGTSLVSDRDYVSAALAAPIVEASGAGSMDPTELRNALAGKIVQIGTFIQDDSEGVIAQASPDDLESLLQLIHLRFTGARRDEQVFASVRSQLAERLEHRDAEPEAVFKEERDRVLWGNHLRKRPLELRDLDALSLDRVLEIYRARFANAGDFTFVFVGRVDPAALAPLVERYLGSLPGQPGAPERSRDHGVRPTNGVRTFEVKKGVEPKSVVSLTFPGTQRWSEEEDHLLDSLVEAVEIRLREVLREELGGTYNIELGGTLEREPTPLARVDVAWSCSPENVDQLLAATWKELDAAKRGGVGNAYLEKVQAAQRRGYDQALTTNAFWLRKLTSAYRFGTDPTAILRQRALIDGLTTARLAEAARRYFDRSRYVLGVLRPATPAVSTPGPAAQK